MYSGQVNASSKDQSSVGQGSKRLDSPHMHTLSSCKCMDESRGFKNDEGSRQAMKASTSKGASCNCNERVLGRGYVDLKKNVCCVAGEKIYFGDK